MVPLGWRAPKCVFATPVEVLEKGDIPKKYLLFKVYMGLIEGTTMFPMIWTKISARKIQKVWIKIYSATPTQVPLETPVLETKGVLCSSCSYSTVWEQKNITKSMIPLILWYETKPIQKKTTHQTQAASAFQTRMNILVILFHHIPKISWPPKAPQIVYWTMEKPPEMCWDLNFEIHSNISPTEFMNSLLTTSTPATKQHVSKQTCLLLQTWICLFDAWKKFLQPILPKADFSMVHSVKPSPKKKSPSSQTSFFRLRNTVHPKP